MKRIKGYGITEYVLGLVVLVTAFSAPDVNGKSVVEILMEAIKQEHSGYVHAHTLNNLPDGFIRKNKAQQNNPQNKADK